MKSIIAGFILGGTATVLSIIGVAIPYWTYFKIDIQDVEVNAGLWIFCSKFLTQNVKKCDDVDADPVIQATRSMEVIGLLASVSALFCFFLGQFILKNKPAVNKVAGGLAISAGVCMAIGAVVFGTDDSYKDNLHAGFGLVIAAAVLDIAASCCMFASPTNT